MCKPGQTLQCGGCWVAVGCHTTSIGKGDRLSHGNPYGPSACHAFYGNWPSRWRSCPVFCSCEHKIKSGFLLCMWRCVDFHILGLLYIFSQPEMPSLFQFPSHFPPKPRSSTTAKLINTFTPLIFSFCCFWEGSFTNQCSPHRKYRHRTLRQWHQHVCYFWCWEHLEAGKWHRITGLNTNNRTCHKSRFSLSLNFCFISFWWLSANLLQNSKLPFSKIQRCSEKKTGHAVRLPITKKYYSI